MQEENKGGGLSQNLLSGENKPKKRSLFWA